MVIKVLTYCFSSKWSIFFTKKASSICTHHKPYSERIEDYSILITDFLGMYMIWNVRVTIFLYSLSLQTLEGKRGIAFSRKCDSLLSILSILQ